jgi:hypothetical protein
MEARIADLERRLENLPVRTASIEPGYVIRQIAGGNTYSSGLTGIKRVVSGILDELPEEVPAVGYNEYPEGIGRASTGEWVVNRTFKDSNGSTISVPSLGSFVTSQFVGFYSVSVFMKIQGSTQNARVLIPWFV